METFGSKLKKLRIKKGLTGEELGKILNVTKMAVSRWESDSRFPDKDTLVKISNFFDEPLDYLLGRTNKKEIKDKSSSYSEIEKNILNEIIKKGKEEDFKKVFDLYKRLVLDNLGTKEPDEEALNVALENAADYYKTIMKFKK